jgi:hypothetical protein
MIPQKINLKGKEIILLKENDITITIRIIIDE